MITVGADYHPAEEQNLLDFRNLSRGVHPVIISPNVSLPQHAPMAATSRRPARSRCRRKRLLNHHGFWPRHGAK